VSDLRERLHDALDEPDFTTPDLMRRASSQLDRPEKRTRLQWAPPLGAAAIAAALIVTLVAVTTHRPGPAAAPSLPTAATVDNLSDYQFVSADVGWILFGAQGEVVARTSDGGTTWHQILAIAKGFAPMSMQAVDADTAVVFGRDLHGEGLVWKTDDAGAHWTVHVVNTTTQPNAVIGVNGYFSDANSGWLLFAIADWPCPPDAFSCPVPNVLYQLVYRTTDGGATWRRIGQAPLQYWTHVAVRFAGPDDGIAVAVNFRPTLIGGGGIAGQDLVTTTHDGGVTWSIPGLALAPPTCCNVFWTAEPDMLPSGGVALVIALYEQAPPTTFKQIMRTLFLSDDGGRTWRKTADLPLTSGAMTVLDERNLIDVSTTGVRRTGDGGATWQTIADTPIPQGSIVLNAEFVDAAHGWVLTTLPSGDHRQAIFATSDGGKTWRPLKLPVVKA
jgi:photosystem II stability/assembly factor-like uncharacterized protein